MIRKTALALMILASLPVFGDGRSRSTGNAPSDAALKPLTVPGATVSGAVTAVSGSVISLANGLVTIDASQAKITGDHSGPATIAAIVPGTQIFAVLSSASVAPGAPLPAAMIAVTRIAQVTLSGPAQPNPGTSTFTLLGRTITVDSKTSFGGGRHHGVADILPNDLVQVQANAVGGALLASSVLVFPPFPKPSTLILGTVKSIGLDAWVITDRSTKEWTVVVNAQTKIIGDPKVGDAVEVLVNVDNSNRHVAVSIVKSIVVHPAIVFSGHVKSISPTSWVITAAAHREITVAVNSQTKITGDVRVNDAVNVTASVDAAGNHTALAITKLVIIPPTIMIRGLVKSIVGTACAATPCTESVWTIGPLGGLGPDFLVRVRASTKIGGDPKVGDQVEVVAQLSSDGGFVALSIAKI
ncbi:MAG TPA: DUF5666 domain-containing protein [Thermoanaerobaculia bacterium]|nr:DUF5666 domain-containing protein [Thermoanaerobaculia bacterium]